MDRYTYDELGEDDKPMDYYSPNAIYDDCSQVLEWGENETFYEKPTDEFHLRDGETKLICRKCGTEEFIVGKGRFFTMIKCKDCGWEQCVHEG